MDLKKELQKLFVGQKLKENYDITIRHEAGHFVMYWLLGVQVTSVTAKAYRSIDEVIEDSKRDGLGTGAGCTRIAPQRLDDPFYRVFYSFLTGLAGYAAEGFNRFASDDPEEQVKEVAQWLRRAIKKGEGGMPFPGEAFRTGEAGEYSFCEGTGDIQQVLGVCGFGLCSFLPTVERRKEAWNNAIVSFPPLVVSALKDVKKIIQDNADKVNEVADLLRQNNGKLDAAACGAIFAKWGEPRDGYFESMNLSFMGQTPA